MPNTTSPSPSALEPLSTAALAGVVGGCHKKHHKKHKQDCAGAPAASAGAPPCGPMQSVTNNFLQAYCGGMGAQQPAPPPAAATPSSNLSTSVDVSYR